MEVIIEQLSGHACVQRLAVNVRDGDRNQTAMEQFYQNKTENFKMKCC